MSHPTTRHLRFSPPRPRADVLGLPDGARRSLLLGSTVLLLALVAGMVRADDRELLRERAADPYVMVLFDTSGSMNRTPVCTIDDAVDDIEPYDGLCTFECPMEAAVCAEVCPTVGCLEYTNVDATPAVDVIIDQASATTTGLWTVDTLPDAFGGSALVTAAGSGATASYSFVPTESRNYQLYLNVPPATTWANNLSIDVTGAANSGTATIDESIAGREVRPDIAPPWRLVGVYELTAGTAVTATVRADGTTASAVADAFRWVSEDKQCKTGSSANVCTAPLCPQGDCNVPLFGDDPASKFFQAKQALYEVLDQISGVRFGFATFEQDNLQAFGKKWLYRTRELQIDSNPGDGIDPPAQTFYTLGTTTFPQAGDLEVLGQTGADTNFLWLCPGNGPGCTFDSPASLSVAAERLYIGGYPKVGERLNRTTTLWVRETPASSTIYRVQYTAASPAFSSTFQVTMNVTICGNAACDTGVTNLGNRTIAYDRISDYLGLDGRYFNGLDHIMWAPNVPAGTDPNNIPQQFLPGCGHPSADGPTGWDPNDDTGPLFFVNFGNHEVDKFANANLRYDTTPDARSNTGNKRAFDEGDVIPWDWLVDADHVDEIQARLAPNTADPMSMERPDFRVATYLNDLPLPTDNPFHPFFRQLRWRDTDERAMIPRGLTPLGYAMESVRRWFLEFSADAGQVVGSGSGGNPLTLDPDWTCRDKFVLMLTDGDDTCSFSGNGALKPGAPNPSSTAEVLETTHDVKTYVVGFGLEADDPTNLDCTRVDDQLTCMAVKGGTDAPIFPRNKEELVRALLALFADVEADARVFASASLPALQASSADKIFFSSFTPLPNTSYWSGRVDVFREPLIDANEPPVCRTCRPPTPGDPSLESGCHLFNIGDTILAQAPLNTEINADPPNGRIGNDLDQRRVLYPLDFIPVSADGRMAQPQVMRSFTLPDLVMPSTAEEAVIEDMAKVFVRPSVLGSLSLSQKADRLPPIYRETLRVKYSSVLEDADPCPGQPAVGRPTGLNAGNYLLGDVFHANPVVTGNPSNSRFFRPNTCGALTTAGLNNCPVWSAGDEEAAFARGYRYHTRRGEWIRRMLMVGANDGQLHFFDSGIQQTLTAGARDIRVFSDGTGAELFSYMPRMAMPIVREQAAPGATQIFSVDGTYVTADVMIDPIFTATPTRNDREWRTVVVGGLREAGDRFDDNRPIEGFVSGYYALDITQPDALDVTAGNPATITDDSFLPDASVAGGVLPSCFNLAPDGTHIASTRSGCTSAGGASLPFPALKWEFTDRVYYFDTDGDPIDESGWYALDEDGSGRRDLGATWSKPLVNQVRVIDLSGEETTRWVAIFGGGIDPARKTQGDVGNWLYMVDIETGGTLYKRQVVGAVPADVTGLDFDEDGIIDTLYVPTTAGFIYKVDLRLPGPIELHTIDDLEIIGWPDTSDILTERIVADIWDPYAIFDADGKPLYFPPAVALVPELQQFALAFGTGDREDLWDFAGEPGRFIVMVDQDFERPVTPSPILPLSEADFITFDFDAPLIGVDGNGQPLADPPDFVSDVSLLPGGGTAAQGWVMRFPIEARVSSRAFLLTGVLVYTVFDPQPPAPSVVGGQVLCRRSGLSRTFVVDIRNGDALTTLKDLRDPTTSRPNGDGLVGGGGMGIGSPANPSTGPASDGDCGDRCTEREGFGTAPFVSALSTKNPSTPGQSAASDPLDSPIMKRLIERLKQAFFPPGCEFNDAFGYMIRMQFDDTGVQNLVPVPIGVCPADWQEGAPVWSKE